MAAKQRATKAENPKLLSKADANEEPIERGLSKEDSAPLSPRQQRWYQRNLRKSLASKREAKITTAKKSEGKIETQSDSINSDYLCELVAIAASDLDLKQPERTHAVDTLRPTNPVKLQPYCLKSGTDQRQKYLQFSGPQGCRLTDAIACEEAREVKKAKQVHIIAQMQRTHDTNKKIAGCNWFDMPTETLTQDIKHDMELIRMRNYLDPKKFYKSSDYKTNFPKHFQVGTVIEGPYEFKSARLPKKQRHQTLTDEIRSDVNIQTYTKRVYRQIQDAKHTRRKLQKKLK